MAPITVSESGLIKRSMSDAGLEESFLVDTRPTKVPRHHLFNWKQPLDNYHEYLYQNEEAIRSILTRSIVLALGAVGFAGTSPLALEAFRAHVEECKLKGGRSNPPRFETKSDRYGALPWESPAIDVVLQANSAYPSRLSPLTSRSLPYAKMPPAPSRSPGFPLQIDATYYIRACAREQSGE